MNPQNLTRRELLRASGAASLAAALPFSLSAGQSQQTSAKKAPPPAAVSNPLKPPAEGSIPVAFLLSDGAVVIDFAGPWEVFNNVMIGNRMDLFQTYTVSESATPVQASGGMQIVPNYTLANAPQPKIIVIPAQGDPTQPMLDWIRNSSKLADLTMSVCTGAFVLAQTGLLAGKSATTHHGSLMNLQIAYPDIHVKRGARFVEEGNLATAAGLSSGIDLALHVVERYYGRDVATETAYNLEYQGQGWMNANSNSAYAKLRGSTAGHPRCPICDMEVDSTDALTTQYRGKTYRFCSAEHKQQFDSQPQTIVDFLQQS